MKKLTSSHYKVTIDKIFFPTLKMVSDVFDMQIFNNQYICMTRIVDEVGISLVLLC